MARTKKTCRKSTIAYRGPPRAPYEDEGPSDLPRDEVPEETPIEDRDHHEAPVEPPVEEEIRDIFVDVIAPPAPIRLDEEEEEEAHEEEPEEFEEPEPEEDDDEDIEGQMAAVGVMNAIMDQLAHARERVEALEEERVASEIAKKEMEDHFATEKAMWDEDKKELVDAYEDMEAEKVALEAEKEAMASSLAMWKGIAVRKEREVMALHSAKRGVEIELDEARYTLRSVRARVEQTSLEFIGDLRALTRDVDGPKRFY